MDHFALRTGLAPDSGNPPLRYLWTDAFALCDFLELYRLTGLGEYMELALRLVDQVHTILGRHRDINGVMLATSLIPDGYLLIR